MGGLLLVIIILIMDNNNPPHTTYPNPATLFTAEATRIDDEDEAKGDGRTATAREGEEMEDR